MNILKIIIWNEKISRNKRTLNITIQIQKIISNEIKSYGDWRM